MRTDLYQADERVRRLVLAAAESGRAEIRLWGEGWPADFGRSGDPVSHRLSLAARAFKAQALAAADLPGAPTQETEVFRRGELRRPRLAAASLTECLIPLEGTLVARPRGLVLSGPDEISAAWLRRRTSRWQDWPERQLAERKHDLGVTRQRGDPGQERGAHGRPGWCARSCGSRPTPG